MLPEPPPPGSDLPPADRLGERDHLGLASWAAGCAEHVVFYFELAHPGDRRPRQAIEAARAWRRGEISVTDARKAAFDAHRAAREVEGDAARFAARAAGHAAATAHVASHAQHAATYARKSVTAGQSDPAAVAVELKWQLERVPDRLRRAVFPRMAVKSNP
jgi:hypothetical protein